MKARALRACVLALWSCWAALCHGAGVEVVDDAGSRVHLSAPPRRVVSLLPSLTETWCALGACDRLVATDRWSNWPEQVRRLPKLGGLDDVQIEGIVAMRPDLVLVAPSSRVTARLRVLGLTVAELDAQDLAGARRVMDKLARLSGASPDVAVRAWQAMDQEIGAAQASLPAAARGLRVYVEVGSSPYAASESSFIGQLLTRLGARNVVPASLGPFPKLNPEFVVKAQPDVILISREDVSSLAARPGWASLRAVRTHRVCPIEHAEYDVLARPGPRMGQAARMLAQCLARQAGAAP